MRHSQATLVILPITGLWEMLDVMIPAGLLPSRDLVSILSKEQFYNLTFDQVANVRRRGFLHCDFLLHYCLLMIVLQAKVVVTTREMLMSRWPVASHSLRENFKSIGSFFNCISFERLFYIREGCSDIIKLEDSHQRWVSSSVVALMGIKLTVYTDQDLKEWLRRAFMLSFGGTLRFQMSICGLMMVCAQSSTWQHSPFACTLDTTWVIMVNATNMDCFRHHSRSRCDWLQFPFIGLLTAYELLV